MPKMLADEGVEYDEAGLAASAAPAVVAAAQRRFDDFPEAEAEAEFYDVLSGLEDAEDEILVAIAQGRADHIEEPKLAPPKLARVCVAQTPSVSA